jgi:hypothetical protein
MTKDAAYVLAFLGFSAGSAVSLAIYAPLALVGNLIGGLFVLLLCFAYIGWKAPSGRSGP